MALDEATKGRIRTAIKRARFALHELETRAPAANGAEMKRLVQNVLDASEDVRVAHIDPVATQQAIARSSALLDELETSLDQHSPTVDHALLSSTHASALLDFNDNTLALAHTVMTIGKQDPPVTR